jgi:hypothetical protein
MQRENTNERHKSALALPTRYGDNIGCLSHRVGRALAHVVGACIRQTLRKKEGRKVERNKELVLGSKVGSKVGKVVMIGRSELVLEPTCLQYVHSGWKMQALHPL